MPSLTELLFELGLGSQVVGRTTFCVHPVPAVEAVPRVGGTKKVRLDRLRALAPTHVLVNIDENRREDVDAIAEFIPHVVVTHPVEPRDNLDLYRLIGGIFNRPTEAAAMARAFEAELTVTRAAARHLPQRRALYLIWKEPWMTVSRPTYISKMLALVNWHTVADHPDLRYPEIALETELLSKTDLVLLSSEPFPFKQHHADALRARLDRQFATQGAEGARTPKIALIDGEYTSWYGSRAVAGLGYLRGLAAELDA